MKNHWKEVVIGLAGVFLGCYFSAHPVKASSILRFTEVKTGPYDTNIVSGDVVCFSCVSDTSGDLAEGSGEIRSTQSCYVLTK